jgi:hypothetical protein
MKCGKEEAYRNKNNTGPMVLGAIAPLPPYFDI